MRLPRDDSINFVTGANCASTHECRLALSLQIKDLKKRVHEERGADFPAESLNLIYSGAIMKDEEQIKDYKIDSKKFIVVMKKKEKTEPAPAPATPAVAAATPAASSSQPAADTAKQTAAPVSSQTAPAPSQPAAAVSAASSSGENEGVIRNMMELGYSRALVESALRLSYNNPDVACEYLISERITEANMNSVEADNLALGGVRDELMELADAYDSSRGGAAAAGGNPENEPLAFLRAQPQFHQMRQQIQENPQFLNTVLQQIGVNNPGLLKLISENQTAFVNMINEPLNNNNNNQQNNRNTATSTPAPASAAAAVAPEQQLTPEQAAAASDLLAAALASQMQGDDDDDGEEEAQDPMAGQPQQVELPELTDGDRAAIGRIREISGFSEIEVIQAYIACGRSEELALNFLFND